MNRWVLGARPRTLPAALVPVLIGTAVGSAEGRVDWWRAGAALVVSLALQVAVNYANDYSDGVRGTDEVRVGPVRLVASGLASPAAVKRAAIGAMAVAGAAGVLLAATVSWWLLAVGAAAMLAAWGYTGGPRPYGYVGLGELFVFVFFGLVATVGSAYVQLNRFTGLEILSAVPAGLLAVALLVVNNLRDIGGDEVVGKRTLAVRVGAVATRKLYAAVLFLPFGLLAAIAVSRPWALLALAALPLAVPPVRKVLGGESGKGLIAVLGQTGRTQLAYGALLALGLVL
jgi:1,4-dihydroxy-2-naphthoate octaprenyltransferase